MNHNITGVAITRLASCMWLLNQFHVALETKLKVKLINLIILKSTWHRL